MAKGAAELSFVFSIIDANLQANSPPLALGGGWIAHLRRALS